MIVFWNVFESIIIILGIGIIGFAITNQFLISSFLVSIVSIPLVMLIFENFFH